MRILLVLLILVGLALANSYDCPYDKHKTPKSQVDYCKPIIQVAECEKVVATHVSSTTEVSSNMVVDDRIVTNTRCADSNAVSVHIKGYKISKNYLIVYYETDDSTSEKVTETNMQKWTDIGIGSTNYNVKATKVDKEDSNTVINFEGKFQFDSKKVKDGLAVFSDTMQKYRKKAYKKAKQVQKQLETN